MDNILDGVNLAINFTISPEVKSKAEGNFLSCTSCGKIFNSNLSYMLPDQPGYNDSCDNHFNCDFTKAQVNSSKSSSDEILKFYEERGLLLNFNITGDLEKYSKERLLERFNQSVIVKYKI